MGKKELAYGEFSAVEKSWNLERVVLALTYMYESSSGGFKKERGLGLVFVVWWVREVKGTGKEKSDGNGNWEGIWGSGSIGGVRGI